MNTLAKIRRRRELKRRFVMAGAATLILVFLLGLVFGSFLSRAREQHSFQNPYKYYANIEIQPGDTLWDLAEQYRDEEHYDSRESYIKEVLRINSLDTADHIVSGQYLVVPYYDDELL